MRPLMLALLLSACGTRALETPEPPPPPCCHDAAGVLVCESDACPELTKGRECETLALDHSCQVPLTDDCQAVQLERTAYTSTHEAFLTVWCF